MHTAESIFSNFVIEYLGAIETEFKNTSACLQLHTVFNNQNPGSDPKLVVTIK